MNTSINRYLNITYFARKAILSVFLGYGFSSRKILFQMKDIWLFITSEETSKKERFAKYLTPERCFRKLFPQNTPFHMFGSVVNTPLELNQ